MIDALGAVAMIIYRPKMDELEKLAIAFRENH